jgi:hypothetical protein
MKATAGILATALLAACASPGALRELQEAERILVQHDTADIFLNVDLVDKGDRSEDQRAPEVKDRLVRATVCGDRFHSDFLTSLNEAAGRPDPAIFLVGRSREIDERFEQCARTFGLSGYPEFKVGNSFLRTSIFVRSYVEASARRGAAQYRVDHEALVNGAGVAAGLGAAARSAASHQPAPLPAPTIQRPIRCTSYRYGGYVNTTCN